MKNNLFIIFFCILFFIKSWAKSDVKPGDKGFGLSCFKGIKIDTFSVEIIGIEQRALPKGDIILAKISDGPIDEAGVIAGMSGSPIYVNGKLIGALAYRWGIFPKVPICGITPIDEMISPPELGYNIEGAELIMPVTNLSPFACELFKNEFGKFSQIMPLEIGASYSEKKFIPEPGAPIGILLVTGDVNLAVIGTCTFKRGKKVYGFGHPFLMLGKTNLPMTGGYVLDVLPSLASSFKIVSPGKIIGRVESDNSRGIIGIIGDPPELIELCISLDGHEYNYNIVKELRLFRSLIEGLLLNVFAMEAKLFEKLTIKYKVNVKTKKYHEINYEDIYVGGVSKGIRLLTDGISYLHKNEFDTIDITKIKISLLTDTKLREAQIIDIIPQKNFVHKNDILPIIIKMKTYKGDIIEFREEIKIPNWLIGNELTIKVSSSDKLLRKIFSKIRNVNELIKFYMERPKNTDILITLTQEDAELLAPHLPNSLSKLLNKETGTLLQKILHTDWVIKGQKSCKITLGE